MRSRSGTPHRCRSRSIRTDRRRRDAAPRAWATVRTPLRHPNRGRLRRLRRALPRAVALGALVALHRTGLRGSSAAVFALHFELVVHLFDATDVLANVLRGAL